MKLIDYEQIEVCNDAYVTLEPDGAVLIDEIATDIAGLRHVAEQLMDIAERIEEGN